MANIQPRLRVYIVGPMTGIPNYNFEAFANASVQLVKLGHQVRTPFYCDTVVWRRHFGRDFDPYKDRCDPGDPILNETYAEDFAAICWCDAVCLLDGWEKSRMGKPELAAAAALHKQFLHPDGTLAHLEVEISCRSARENIKPYQSITVTRSDDLYVNQ